MFLFSKLLKLFYHLFKYVERNFFDLSGSVRSDQVAAVYRGGRSFPVYPFGVPAADPALPEGA